VEKTQDRLDPPRTVGVDADVRRERTPTSTVFARWEREGGSIKKGLSGKGTTTERRKRSAVPDLTEGDRR